MYVFISKHGDRTTPTLPPLCVVGRTGLSRFRLHLDSTLTLEHLLHALHVCQRHVCVLYIHFKSLPSTFEEGAIGHHFLNVDNRNSALTLQYGACVSASAGPQESDTACTADLPSTNPDNAPVVVDCLSCEKGMLAWLGYEDIYCW